MAQQLEQRSDSSEVSRGTKRRFPWPCPKGFYWELLLKRSKGEPYECGLCGLLSRDVVELICREHLVDDDDEKSSDEDSDGEGPEKMQVFCKGCLESHAQEKGCPLGNHPNPKFQTPTSVQDMILKLKICCPTTLAHR